MLNTNTQAAEPLVYSTEELRAVLDRISFKNTALDFKWEFEITEERLINDEGIWLLNVSFERPDTLTGVVDRGRGRQEIIREGSTISSIVKTAWLLVELMVRHELMEGFRFDNARIFNPHNSVFDLAKIQRTHDEKLTKLAASPAFSWAATSLPPQILSSTSTTSTTSVDIIRNLLWANLW